MRRASPLLLSVLVLSLGGCRFDVAADLTIDRDGSALAAVELRLDGDALSQLDDLGVDPTAELAAAAREVPEWEVARSTDDDGSLSVRLSRASADAADAADAFRELSAGLADADPALLVDLLVEVDEEGAVDLHGVAGLRPPATVGLSVDGEPLGPEGAALAQLTADAVDARFSVTVPGELVTHDADVVEGRTVTWELEPGELRDVRAVAAAPTTIPTWLVAGGAALLLVAAGGLLLWRRRR